MATTIPDTKLPESVFGSPTCKPGCGTVFVDGKAPYCCDDLFHHGWDVCYCKSNDEGQFVAWCSRACRKAQRSLKPAQDHIHANGSAE